ncbi:MAG: glycosyltransferase, partial [Lentisphaerae bacterium]|nr:glycosyltransferase [Lentisphaerota bacterium]
PGMDVTFFDNAVNIEREQDWWPPNVGERAVLRKGTDIEELDRQSALPRSPWNIPDDAVVIGLLSNHLERRLTEPYMDAIARVLKEQANVRFLAFGSEALPEKMNFFRARGVADRVRFGGKQRQAGSALKVLDIYANEFPEGGSQSLIEAMVCGVPVAALRWDDSHHGSVGAEIVGKEWAIGERDLDRYRELILRWARSPVDRREAGRQMRQRAEQEFSARHYVAAVMRDLEARLRRKLNECISL